MYYVRLCEPWHAGCICVYSLGGGLSDVTVWMWVFGGLSMTTYAYYSHTTPSCIVTVVDLARTQVAAGSSRSKQEADTVYALTTDNSKLRYDYDVHETGDGRHVEVSRFSSSCFRSL